MSLSLSSSPITNPWGLNDLLFFLFHSLHWVSLVWHSFPVTSYPFSVVYLLSFPVIKSPHQPMQTRRSSFIHLFHSLHCVSSLDQHLLFSPPFPSLCASPLYDHFSSSLTTISSISLPDDFLCLSSSPLSSSFSPISLSRFHFPSLKDHFYFFLMTVLALSLFLSYLFFLFSLVYFLLYSCPYTSPFNDSLPYDFSVSLSCFFLFTSSLSYSLFPSHNDLYFSSQ